MKPLNRKLIRDLVHLRGQVVAVALVVACGVAAFVAMRSIHQSLLRSQEAYYRQFRFADVFAQLKRAPESLGPRIAAIPGVSTVQTRIVANATLDVPGVVEPVRGRIVSISENATPTLNDLHLLDGRYIEPGRRDEVIISGAFSDANHLRPGDSLTAIINGRWQRLRIVGVGLSPEYVYEIAGGEMFPDSRRFGVMWMNRASLAAAFDMEAAFNDVTLSLSPGAVESDVIARLDELLDDYGGLGAFGRADQTSHYFIVNEIAELTVIGTFIPAIFLGVTAFLLNLTLSRLVTMQRDQIAVLKAFGYGNFSIGSHYLKLAFGAVAGGVALGIWGGNWFGYRLTSLYTDYFRFPVLRYEAGTTVVITAILISLLSASAGALSAVWQAVRLPPAEAMHPEPPARFRAGFIERLGLTYFLSPTARHIIRNLARRPLKALLSILGISLSSALLVTGFFLYYDAIDRVVDVMFNNVYREDVSMAFNEPRPARVRYEVARLKGVTRVEAHRVVPARLRLGHRSRRLALTGLETGSELWRIVDTEYRIHTVPPEGVVLTTTLAESLGARPGMVLTVEVLEGKRPVLQVPVADTVDDLLGMSAYMELGALNRLMQEGGTVSGLHLMVDVSERAALFAMLKRTPAVGGVVIPSALLDSFNETLGRTFGTSTGVLIFFACVIAFGVVYSGARIALSERGRELASLRVLGFTRREVSAMLIGEHAILVGLAIPVGWALGYGLSWLVTWAIDTELMRLPLVISGRTLARAALIVAMAAGVSALLVARRLRGLDLIAVLKSRE